MQSDPQIDYFYQDKLMKNISDTSAESNKNPTIEKSAEIPLYKKPSKKNLAGSSPEIDSIFIDSDLLVEKVSGTPLDHYTVVSKIGEGFYGTVVKVKNKITGNICAMKKMAKKETLSIEDEMVIINEIEMMKKMDHPNIVKIFQFYITKDAYYIIMEYCQGGELYYEIVNHAPFSEDASAFIMYQIFSAVFYCHSNNIIHRDLKPENILIEKKEINDYFKIKICDFGTAKIYEKGRVERKIIGSSYYIAPEVLQKSYDERCDLWSCGVIMYILLSGRPPFEGDTDQEVMERVRVGKYDLTKPPFNKISKDAKDLISSLMQIDPEERLSAGEALKHPWFKKFETRQKIHQIVNPENKKVIERFICNLKTYTNKNILTKATVAFLVHNFPQLDEIENAGKLFTNIDLNGDGKISKEELIAYLRNFSNLSQEDLEQEVIQIFLNIDTNFNGFIEFSEFVAAAIDKGIFLTDEIMKFAFRHYDKDDNGTIEYEEIKQTFLQEESNRDNPDIEPMLKEIFDFNDSNKNGKISFQEFKDMMKSILKQDAKCMLN